MATNQQKLDTIVPQIKNVWDNVVGAQQANYAKYLGTKLQPYFKAAIEQAAPFIVKTLLDTPIDRQGLGKDIGKGKTSLRALLAWNDDHVARTFSAAGEAATPAEVGAEVRKGLESITIEALPTAAAVETVNEVKA